MKKAGEMSVVVPLRMDRALARRIRQAGQAGSLGDAAVMRLAIEKGIGEVERFFGMADLPDGKEVAA